ncbi:MAG: ABC transporter ATP-binding protein [Ilumatobacteraceae bacterium]|nr:ABC transporter ATP-binding protein [Ilumatobacteraceae bacterium]
MAAHDGVGHPGGLTPPAPRPSRCSLRSPDPTRPRAVNRDDDAIAEAIELVGLTDFANRDGDTLSGGERQRAWLALALAQETPVLAHDEPTTFLDIGHQWEVLELVRRLNVERGLTVLMVLHDLNHVATFSEQMFVLRAGRVVASGDPWSALTVELLRDVFGVEASVVPDPTST